MHESSTHRGAEQLLDAGEHEVSLRSDRIEPVALSDASSRDQEVTTYMRIGYIFLRLVGGKAVYFNHNASAGSGTLDIGIVTGWTTVRGIRVIGTADSPSGYTNIFCNASGNSIVNCVADTITGNATGCMTNAQWIAGGGH